MRRDFLRRGAAPAGRAALRAPFPASALAALALAALLLAGCDASSSLFSEAERSAIYDLSLSFRGGPVAEGSALEGGAELEVELGLMRGAEAPALLSIELQDAKGGVLSSRRYETEAAAKAAEPGSQAAGSSAGTAADSAAAAEAPLRVKSLSGSLPSLRLPESLPPGAYRLETRILGREGALLDRSAILVFVGLPGQAAPALSLYPPKPRPGSAVLLSASLSGVEGDPWLRWSAEGRLLAEGPRSKGLDKTVWRAPGLASAYAIRVDVYPAPPEGRGYEVGSPWRQDMKAIVSGPPLADEYSDPTSFLSRFAFDGSFEESGSRLIEERPLAFGSPRLEVYSGGFGYRLGPAAGLSAPGAVPPSEEGRPRAFSLLWRLGLGAAALEGSSTLARFLDVEGREVLVVGVEEGRPFLSLGREPGAARSRAGFLLSPGTVDLALSLEAEGDALLPVWTLAGEASPSPSLPLRSFTPPAELSLGGHGSLEAVYDEFGLRDDSASGPPALYRAAARRAYGESLILAEGFEAFALPSGLSVAGLAGLGPRSLSLGQDASLQVQEPLPLERALAAELRFEGRAEGLVVELSDGEGAVLLSMAGSGEVLGPDGAILGRLGREAGRLAFALRAQGGFLELSPPRGLPVARAALPGSLASVSLSLRNSGERPVVLRRLLVRAAPELLAQGPRPSLARLP